MSRAAAQWSAEILREQAADLAAAVFPWQVDAAYEGLLTAAAMERAAEVRAVAAEHLMILADALDAASREPATV
ncbi:hypothetical protein BJ973_004012 [Actinoplanes tereljensis]|uniref:Uncharacterized protein n=1 Tax=Paractinoplanes tereljensis TaxID=571912 RepID=A0A919NYN1_9ACTN|nr:hypothetical protein [Actinoplanes tereljensis]GIF25737.1 hypothetical protein Ate02nite_84670 [Actinoplanes tereljensis]